VLSSRTTVLECNGSPVVQIGNLHYKVQRCDAELQASLDPPRRVHDQIQRESDQLLMHPRPLPVDLFGGRSQVGEDGLRHGQRHFALT
jgi:hypothetical protein